MKRIRVGGQLLGHEAQLDKRPNFILQQPVINLIDVREIVERLSRRVFVVQSRFVMKNGVEANILKTRDAFGFAKILAIAFAQRKNGPPGAKHFFPEVWKRMRSGIRVNFDYFSGRLRLCAGLRARACTTQHGQGRQQCPP